MQKRSFIISRFSVLVIVLVAFTMLSFITSCRENSDPQQQALEVELNGTIDVPILTEGMGATKAASTDLARAASFLNEDQISVYIVPRSESSAPDNRPQIALRPTGNYRDNIIYKYDLANTKFTLVGALAASYPNSKTYIDIYGIFPSIATSLTSTTNHAVAVKTAQANKVDFLVSDFMNAVCLDKQPGTTPAELSFHHRLSRIILNITVPTIYKGVATKTTGAITEIRILGTKTSSEINLTNTTDAPTVIGAAQNVTAYLNPTVATGNIYNAEAILIPQTANLAIEADLYTTDNQKHTLIFSKSDAVFAPKTKYEYAFTVLAENALTLGNSAISVWGTEQKLTDISNQKVCAEEKFSLTYSDVLAKSFKVKCDDGVSYIVPVTVSAGAATFAFNGIFLQAPENYPYTIISIQPLDAANANLGAEIAINKRISTRTTSVITLP